MGVSNLRRKTTDDTLNKNKSVSPKRSSSKDELSTPRTFMRIQERKASQKENLANLFAELKITPGSFCLQNSKSERKEWKVRATSLQSPQARRLCRNLQKTKQLLRSFSQNSGYNNIFKRIEKTKEDEERRFMLEAAMSYSPVELVSRNLIDKVANSCQRERCGVWSQLGRPYSCLGLPATSIPKEHPKPNEIQHFDVEGVSPFFQTTSKPTTAPRISLMKTLPITVQRSQMFQKGSSSHLNLQCLLLKMGLSHLHDVKHTKFPKKPLEIADQLRKTVRVLVSSLFDLQVLEYHLFRN